LKRCPGIGSHPVDVLADVQGQVEDEIGIEAGDAGGEPSYPFILQILLYTLPTRVATVRATPSSTRPSWRFLHGAGRPVIQLGRGLAVKLYGPPQVARRLPPKGLS
jgi:hypothetical protein